MRKKPIIIIAVLLLCVLFSACGKDEPVPSPEVSSPALQDEQNTPLPVKSPAVSDNRSDEPVSDTTPPVTLEPVETEKPTETPVKTASPKPQESQPVPTQSLPVPTQTQPASSSNLTVTSPSNLKIN